MVTLNESILDRIGLPDAYKACRINKIPDIPETKLWRDTLIRYVGNIEANIEAGIGLYLFGDYSRGKSGAGAIILKAAAVHDSIGLWLRCDKLPKITIENHYFDDVYTYRERAVQVPILVLDELIVWKDNRDWYLESLIRDRVNDKKATIITSNIVPTDLKRSYPALAAVLKEATVSLHVDGFDFREQIAIKNVKRIKEGWK